jgi:hypothetical protein
MEALAQRLRDEIGSRQSVTRAIDLVSAWIRTEPEEDA